MSAQTAPISIPSIFRTLSAAPRTREHHQAARQLASLDPKRFLSNLQAAAVNRSPHAITALKTDMLELEDIFHKLSISGHDVSAAQRDFQMLEHFVSQLASAQKQRSPVPASQSKSKQLQAQVQYTDGSYRTSSLPSSMPSSHEKSQTRTGSFSIESTHSSTRYQPHAIHAQVPSESNAHGKRSAPGSTSSSASSSSRSSSSRSSPSSQSPKVVAPVPSHLTKPRRHSDPASLSSKKVHFASHATVYTFAKEAPALVPPPRPSCIPRVGGHENSRSSSHDGRHRY